MLLTPSLRYSKIMQTLHWLTAIIVLVAFIYGPGGSEERIYSSARDFDRQLHETLGLAVFVLVFVRLIWRLFDNAPASPPMPRWMERTAKGVQAGLYVLMFLLPISAICGAWLEGHPVTLLGRMTISPLLTESHAIGVTIAELHGWLGDAIMWIAGLHAAAALYHHFMLKDNVLVAMLPRRFTPRDR